jgi:hypothetical protein
MHIPMYGGIPPRPFVPMSSYSKKDDLHELPLAHINLLLLSEKGNTQYTYHY